MVKGLSYRLSKLTFFILFLVSSIYLSGCSCGCSKAGKKYYIGIDPTFYPLGLGFAVKNVYCFSQELLLEMSEVLNVRFFVVRANWDNLLQGLESKNYQAMFSSSYPYQFTKDKYNYSGIILNTGFALTVRKNGTITSLEKMNDKLVGYLRGEDSIFILEKYPQIIVKMYDSLPVLLADVNNGFLDGAIVKIINGTQFVNNLYYNTLDIKSPLTEEGIRVISLKNDEEIVKLFDKGLEKLEKQGVLAKLKKKWNL
jgi:ABC-type amino acid transport substrate-binding protein